MTDSNAALVAWLMQSDAIADLVANQAPSSDVKCASLIFCGMLPQGYKPDVNGPAITFSCRGGDAPAEVPIINPSVQIECWAPALANKQARQLYGAVFDQIANKNNIDLGSDGFILACTVEVLGQDLTDPDTEWPSVLGYFRLTLRN